MAKHLWGILGTKNGRNLAIFAEFRVEKGSISVCNTFLHLCILWLNQILHGWVNKKTKTGFDCIQNILTFNGQIIHWETIVLYK